MGPDFTVTFGISVPDRPLSTFFWINCYASQTIRQEKYEADYQPENRFYPTACLRSLKRRNTKEEQEHCKVSAELYSLRNNLPIESRLQPVIKPGRSLRCLIPIDFGAYSLLPK